MENKSLNRNDILLNTILEKYQECKDKSFLDLATYHLGIYEQYLPLLKAKGSSAFPHRLEYQKFEVAKLFIDKMKLLEFSLDPSLKGFGEYKDSTLPPLDAFSMSLDTKETRKMKFLKNIDRGDLLNLRVVETGTDSEHLKMLVLNKHNDKERVADYFIYAYMVKSHQLNKLPRSLQQGDLMRAAVLGKLKMEGNRFSKLLVTVNDNIVNEKYKHLDLGLVFESEIPFYPEDISDYNCFLNFMKANKSPEDTQEMIKCLYSLGIDPYKIYSFHGAADGKKLGEPKEPRSEVELKLMEKSMSLVKKCDKECASDVDRLSFLRYLEEALEIYPENDVAYAIRGQLHKALYVQGKGDDYIVKALEDFKKALDLNGYNLTATREYLSLLALSAQLYEDEGNDAKSAQIMKILVRCKDVCDATKTVEIMANNAEQNKS